jgi:hypothetical protein
MLGTAAQKADPRRRKNLAIGEDDVKQVPLLMDAAKNGTISKQQFVGIRRRVPQTRWEGNNRELYAKELVQCKLCKRYYARQKK